MAISDFTKEYNEKMFSDVVSELRVSDPEFIERFDNFAFDEVVNEKGVELDGKTRMTCILAVLLGCQGIDEFKIMLPAALNFGVTAIEVREIVYQAVDYLGIGRVLPFLKAMNEFFESKEIALPLENQATTTMEDRLEKGIQAQVDIFGGHMKDFYKSGPEELRHINKWLAANCFGDFYTRKGLDYKVRELITFCFLYAQGGCEPQVVTHCAANMKLGNDKHFLICVVSQCLPFIGYPRTLNALRCIDEAVKKLEAEKKTVEG